MMDFPPEAGGEEGEEVEELLGGDAKGPPN